METKLTESEFCARVERFIRAYRAIEPGPTKLCIINRKFNRSAGRIGRSVMEILESDGRFSFALLKGGATTVQLRADLDSQREALDRAWSELD